MKVLVSFAPSIDPQLIQDLEAARGKLEGIGRASHPPVQADTSVYSALLSRSMEELVGDSLSWFGDRLDADYVNYQKTPTRVMKEHYDLVLLDARSPGPGLMKLFGRLRSELAALPIILLTSSLGHQQDEAAGVVEKCLAEPRTELLDVPFQPTQLRHRLRVMCDLDGALCRDLPSIEEFIGVRPDPKLGKGTYVGAPPKERLPLLLAQLHDPKTGRLDAGLVAEYMGVKVADLAPLLGAKASAIYRTPAAKSLQPALIPMKRCLEIASDLLGDDVKVRAWLNIPQPPLGDRQPIALILSGQTSTVRSLLENVSLGNPV